ncbi:hypothetical protein [Sellimonas intestinalis]|uniref:hypothetical protein n=2 Tax=Sellimonas intestinalis TaxID=1653434 RepID=UPI0039F59CF9
MQELEKILEEIENTFKENIENIEDENGVHHFVIDSFTATFLAKEIIRKHMNDGWIPVEERIPEVPDDMEDEYCPEFNVTIKGASRATTLKYSPDGAWFDDSGQVYVVIAWRPLPDLYRSEKGAEIETKQDGTRKED